MAQLSKPGSNANFPDFKIRESPLPPDFASLFERVVAVERLREAVALIGFTRVDPPGEPDTAGDEADVGPLCRGHGTWAPCIEVRGEGLFIQLGEGVIAPWEARVTESARLATLRKAISVGELVVASIPTVAGPVRATALCTASAICSCESSLLSVATDRPASVSASTPDANPSRWREFCSTRRLPTARGLSEDS